MFNSNLPPDDEVRTGALLFSTDNQHMPERFRSPYKNPLARPSPTKGR